MNKFIRLILGSIIIIIAFLSTVVSTGLSIMYFQNLTTDDTLSMVVVLFIILLQIMVLFGSISKGLVYKTTPQHYYTIVYFTRICFLISVLSTISFFNQFDKTDRIIVIQDLLYAIPFLTLNNNDWLVTNLSNMTLIWLSCIVIDLMSMFFPAVGADLIGGISTRKKINIEDKNYFMKIIDLLTYKPKQIIDNKLAEIQKLEVSKDELANEVSKNEVSKLANQVNELAIKVSKNEVSKNEIVSNKVSEQLANKELAINEKLAEFENKVSNKLASIDIPIINEVSKQLATKENQVSKLVNDELVNNKLAEQKKEVSKDELANNKLVNNKLANEVSKDELAEKKKKNQVSKLADNKVSELANEVSNYIKTNYEIEETIKTKELLTKFNLTKSEWYKLKNSLDIIETIGTKTKRAI